MSFKNCIACAIAIVGTFAAAGLAGWRAPARADAVSYPWCTQGEELHCYYSTRQQCEEEVDYHGFCVNNPDFAAPDTGTPRRARRQ
jgi:hypothetical protein